MKKTLLITLLLSLPLFSFAQLPIGPAASLLFSGVQAGSKSIKNRANKPDEFVTHFKVGQDSISMKRTPAGKVRGDAASKQVESYLSGVHQLYLQPQTESICPDAQTGQYLLRAIATQQPKWDTTPYQAELAFYQQQHQHRYSVARQAEQRAREAAQRCHQVQQDSVMQIAHRQQAITDSITRLAFIRLLRPAKQKVVVQSPGPPLSVADELLKLQQLREQGVLTSAEFEEQKRRLLY